MDTNDIKTLLPLIIIGIIIVGVTMGRYIGTIFLSFFERKSYFKCLLTALLLIALLYGILRV